MAPNKRISDEYIRGLTEGEGTFTFSTSNGRRVPAFSIKMHTRDKHLLEMVRDSLGIKNRVYEYHYKRNDGAKRGPEAMLIVREIGNLKNVIVPFFLGKLAGNKGRQFDAWIKRIKEDPMVPDVYKIISKNCESGFYGRK